MNTDAKNQKEKIDAALQLLFEDTTSIAKFEKVRILIKGFSPNIDKTLNACSGVLKKLKKIQKFDVISLSAEALPENTEKEKKRKKLLLLFISFWKDLRSEVIRVQKLLKEQNADGKVTTQEQLATFGKVAVTSKGPFGLVTVLAVGIVAVGGALLYLNSVAVDITVKNEGCSPIEPIVKLPVKLPGVELPTETIPSGGQAVAKVPPFKVTVDGTGRGFVTISAIKFKMEYNFSSNTSLIFDNQSLIGSNTTLDLSSSKHHELRIICGK